MLELPASAPLHSSLAGCPYCENFCYDHYLEWRWRRASVVCPAVPRARANFSGGLALARSRIRSRSRSPNLNRNPNPTIPSTHQVTAALFFDRQPKALQGEALVLCNSLVALVMVGVAVRDLAPTLTPP